MTTITILRNLCFILHGHLCSRAIDKSYCYYAVVVAAATVAVFNADIVIALASEFLEYNFINIISVSNGPNTLLLPERIAPIY